MKKDKNVYLNAKVVLLGESGSGKTNIVSRYIKKSFDNVGNATSSCTYDSKMIEINNKFILLDIWDTPGNESLHKLNTLFIKNADAIILVYEIDNASHFKDLQNYWELYIKPNIPKNTGKKKNILLYNLILVISLVGAKSDLILYEKEKKRKNSLKK